MILVVRSNKFRYIPGQRAPESQGGQVTSGTPNVTAVAPKGYNQGCDMRIFFVRMR